MLSTLDWGIVAAYFALALGVGLWASKQAKSDAAGYFLAGRNMPWWLLGVSMVATTFSTDTPNLVTDLVRQQGVSGNWAWWAFLLTGMVTVFVYARLWRRSGVLTDISFYELRYGGRPAAFLRGFRALYLGLVFNVLVMATVSLAAIKLGGILLGWPGWLTLLVTCSITLAYSVLGGLRAVILTDFVQFILAMVGSVWAASWILGLPEVGGLEGLLSHPDVQPKLAMLPDLSDPDAWIPMLLIPLAVQWWSSYYPGAEPGGGGYIAQRMFSAKDEGHAVGATLLFNVAHYALRPWPWILVALASIVVFPDLDALRMAFPAIAEDKVGHDLAYPAMLSLLPSGLLGLVAASLLAAFMSTMSTQLNLGASYLVHDFYGRFIRPDASERQRVVAGQVATGVSLVIGAGIGPHPHRRRTGVQFVAVAGGGDRRALFAPLVLVAHFRMDGGGGHAHLAGGGGVFHLGPRRVDRHGPCAMGEVDVGHGHHHSRLASQCVLSSPRIPRSVAGVCPAHGGRWTRLVALGRRIFGP